MKTYLGFEDIPAYNFYKIAETSDMRWFIKKYRIDRTLGISKEEEIKLVSRYKEIYDERIKYTNDVKSIEYYRKLNEISDLETKMFRLVSAFNCLIDIKFNSTLFKEFVSYFSNDEGLLYSEAISNKEESLNYVNWLSIQIGGIKTKLAVKKSNYSDVLKVIDNTPKKVNFDIIREKVILQESLGLMINIYTCPLIEWCAMIIRAEEKSTDSKKQLDKIKNKR